MTTKGAVVGMALLDNELYVLSERNVDQVDVYSTTDFSLQHHLSIPGLKGEETHDLTACSHNRCLYVANVSTIFRVDKLVELDKLVTKWQVRDVAWRLSLTPILNLLITCWGHTAKLVELHAFTGSRVRVIQLEPAVDWPHHGVQLQNNQYIVCHGGWKTRRLSLVDVDGKIVRSTCKPASMYLPRHVVLDKDEFVFVADCSHNRIARCNPSLNEVESLLEGLQKGPKRLCLDDVSRRLYVGQDGGIISVVQMMQA